MVRSASAVWRVVSTSCWACTASASALLARASACDCSSDFAATAMALAWLAISVACCCSISRMATSRSASTWRVRTICCRSISASSILRSARIRADSASRRRSASIAAILALCSAVRVFTRCCCSRVMKASCCSISRRRESASRFFSLMATSTSCSTSLRSRRRRSVSWVRRVRPSASKALSGLKCTRAVWLKLVSDTLSSSRPFLDKSSATVFWTP
ncbi:Uncharacterised protein [Shigella sonnei]|nr:Uncharacterised protein [Shigella sonnei]CSO22009.1 Uncharacterised protein [Shigella sonnei]